MLRADVIVFEKPCFFLSKDQNTSTSICETFEHNAKRSTDLCISPTCNPGRTRTDSERSARSMTTRPDGSGAVDSPSGKGGCLTALPERVVAADWVTATRPDSSACPDHHSDRQHLGEAVAGIQQWE